MSPDTFPWTVDIILSAIGLVALALALPFSTKPIRWVVAIVILLLLILSGLILATIDNIQVSALTGWSLGKIISPEFLLKIGWILFIGASVGIVLVAAVRLLSQRALPQLRARFIDQAKYPLWKRLVIALYSGILEEIIYRLFLLSLLAWLIGLIWHSEAGQPITGALWLANALAALVFGLVHLPRWSTLTNLTPPLILALISMNGLGGFVFGYLFLTYGIEAAISAHIMGDIVLHIIGTRFIDTR